MGRGIIAFAELGRTSSSDTLISGSTSSRVGLRVGAFFLRGGGDQVFIPHQSNGRRKGASCQIFFDVCYFFCNG